MFVPVRVSSASVAALLTLCSAVVDFAKRTGDFRSLSRTDLRVVALARMFEVERNGTSRLRQGPQPVGRGFARARAELARSQILVNPAKEKSTQEAATDQAESTDDLNSAEQVSLDVRMLKQRPQQHRNKHSCRLTKLSMPPTTTMMLAQPVANQFNKPLTAMNWTLILV